MRLARLLVVLLATPAVWGCSCIGDGSPCLAAGRSAAVFIGSVEDITAPLPPSPPDGSVSRRIASSRRRAGEPGRPLSWPKRTVRLRISEALSGVSPGQQEIVISTGLGGGDCGFPFERGLEYVVYAFRNSEGRLETNICSRTRQLDAAAEDIRYIRENAHAPALGEIRVITTVPGIPPRPGETVVAEGGGMQYRARSDAAGVATFAGIPPGEYGIAFEGSSDHTRLQMYERGCAQITLVRTLRITGRVMSGAEEPAARLRVQALTIDGRVERGAMTDQNGRDDLRITRPGRYRIAIDRSPRWFYPGTSDEASATVVEFAGDDGTRAMDFLLPAPDAR